MYIIRFHVHHSFTERILLLDIPGKLTQLLTVGFLPSKLEPGYKAKGATTPKRNRENAIAIRVIR